MNKYIILLLISLILITGGIVVLAAPEGGTGTIPANDKADNLKQDYSPVIDENWLRTTGINPEKVRYREFIHWDKSKKADVTGVTQTVSGTCYGSFAQRTSMTSYVINSNNKQRLPPDFITGAISTSAETWDGATNMELFNDSYVIDTTVIFGRLDGKNVFVFGNTQLGIIAMARTWYETSTGNIVDSDVLFNQKFIWGDADISVSRVMDLQNIATHEIGHTVGLVDQYDAGTCSDVTMYGYSGYDEIKKRDLANPDIKGIQALYP